MKTDLIITGAHCSTCKVTSKNTITSWHQGVRCCCLTWIWTSSLRTTVIPTATGLSLTPTQCSLIFQKNELKHDLPLDLLPPTAQSLVCNYRELRTCHLSVLSNGMGAFRQRSLIHLAPYTSTRMSTDWQSEARQRPGMKALMKAALHSTPPSRTQGAAQCCSQWVAVLINHLPMLSNLPSFQLINMQANAPPQHTHQSRN